MPNFYQIKPAIRYPMRLKAVLELFKESITTWFRSDAAALAYYTIFSLAPLLIITIFIATQMFSQAAVEGRIVSLDFSIWRKVHPVVCRQIRCNNCAIIRRNVY